jgi:hypothetical protein
MGARHDIVSFTITCEYGKITVAEDPKFQLCRSEPSPPFKGGEGELWVVGAKLGQEWRHIYRWEADHNLP